MIPQQFNFDIDVDEEYITIRWKRLPGQSYDGAMARYPELQLRFTYRDISLDTIGGMLKDMEVPSPVSKGILTRITAIAS